MMTPSITNVNILFLFFINLVNLIINKAIIPQYTNGNIGNVIIPIKLIRAVDILTPSIIRKPKNAAIRNKNSIILSLISTAINLEEINNFGFIGNGNMCSMSPEK